MKKLLFLIVFLFLVQFGVCNANEGQTLLSHPYKANEFIYKFNKKLNLSQENLSNKNKNAKKSALDFYIIYSHLFYDDIFTSYKNLSELLPNSPSVPIAGDVHIGNFGTLKSRNEQVVWGINDFDLAFKGNPEWDLERYAVSLVLKAREMNLSEEDQKKLVTEFATIYCNTIILASKRDVNPYPYLNEKNSSGDVKALIIKSQTKRQLDLLEKYTEAKYLDYSLKGKGLKELSFESKDIISALLRLHFKYIDIIHDVCEKTESGGSTYGLKRYWACVSLKTSKLPVIFEFKQILPNPSLDLTGDLLEADAKIMVDMLRGLGGNQSLLFSHCIIDGYSYIIREKETCADDISLETIKDIEQLSSLNRQCAVVLASAHGYYRQNSKKIVSWMPEGQRDKLISRLCNFSITYSNQVETYHKNLTCD